MSFRNQSAGVIGLVVVLIISAGWVYFLSWLLSMVLGWFGISLALWQCAVIVLLVSALTSVRVSSSK